MFLNKLRPRTRCSFSEWEGGEVLKCWAGPATKNGLVLKCVKVTLYAAESLISPSAQYLQYLTFATEFGLIVISRGKSCSVCSYLKLIIRECSMDLPFIAFF